MYLSHKSFHLFLVFFSLSFKNHFSISAGDYSSKTFTVRKISNGVGVERIFPFHSPNVENIKVVKRGKVRRAKLYYLRSRKGKAAKIKSIEK